VPSAGADTGKTTTLIARIMHLVHNNLVDPRSVLVVTFTKKAAEEVCMRLAGAGIPSGLVPCTTFHAFCMRVITRWHKVGGWVGGQAPRAAWAGPC
jgi:DNA helicase-2/ATP-dependent DNA helicase PcrA